MCPCRIVWCQLQSDLISSKYVPSATGLSLYIVSYGVYTVNQIHYKCWISVTLSFKFWLKFKSNQLKLDHNSNWTQIKCAHILALTVYLQVLYTFYVCRLDKYWANLTAHWEAMLLTAVISTSMTVSKMSGATGVSIRMCQGIHQRCEQYHRLEHIRDVGVLLGLES